MRETHEHVGARHLPCAQCRMPVWHRDHVHQAPVEMQIDLNLEERRDTRDPNTIAKALFYQQSWQHQRGLTMKLHQVADLLPHMDLSLIPEEPSVQGKVPWYQGSYQTETIGPLKGSQLTIYPEPGNRSNHQ